MDFETIQDVIVIYEKIVPKTDSSLRKILDPTYSLKSIKQIAYGNFVEAVSC